MKRALAQRATKSELLEALEAAVVPGGTPTFLTGIAALMQVEEGGKGAAFSVAPQEAAT